MSVALVVTDMQNDYLYEKRKAKFAYDTDDLVGNVNRIIHKYNDEGKDVIYIRHIIQNLPTNKILFGYSLEGTEGAELYGGLDIVSDYCFDKMLGDAFTTKAFRDFIKEKGYDELHICGLDECGCVTDTSLGAAKRGIKACIIKNGTATVLPEKKVQKAHNRLKEANIEFITA